MKKINRILSIIMGTSAGLFVVHSAFIMWNFKTRPELYAMQSAPWYTGILLYGVLTLSVLAVCLLLKGILRLLKKRQSNNTVS